MKNFRQMFPRDAGSIVLIYIAHESGSQRGVGLFLGIQQAKQSEKFTLKLQVAARGLVPKAFQMLKDRKEKDGAEGTADRQHQPAGAILGIGGFKVDVVVFRLGTGKRGVLPGVFLLDIPIARTEGGHNLILGKLKGIFEHENEDKVSAETGTVVFIYAETFQLAVCQIGHGCRRQKNSFHCKTAFPGWFEVAL